VSRFGKAFLAGVMVLALSIGLVAVAEAQPPIRIGASASKTGTYAALGQNQLRGYQLCVKHTNDKGGVLGRKLELVVEDDQSQSATAIRIYERLITQEKVDLVLGPYGSPMTAPVASVTEKHRMPMVAPTVGYETLGRTAEFVYGPTPWTPELVTLRAGGLIPIARQYPGAREFVESHRREFPGADFTYQTAGSYAMCQILVEATKRAGSLDGAKIRDRILKLDLHTVFGAFKVDQDGVQIAHKMLLFQWQDGKKVVVWPEELAPGKPRFPTPPWTQRP